MTSKMGPRKPILRGDKGDTEDAPEIAVALSNTALATDANTETDTYERFYRRRHTLFSLYDKGIRISDKMWFSVTPESIADRTADRIKQIWSSRGINVTTVVDLCGGAGGNSIAFSRAGFKTVYVDINADNLADAIHNSHIYGRYDIDFYRDDVLKIDLAEIAPDKANTVVFSSPEWSGPGYKKQPIFDTDSCTPRVRDLVDRCSAQGYTSMAIFLPRTSDLEQLRSLGAVRIEYMYEGSWRRGLVAYWQK